MDETWATILEAPRYSISTFGRVWSTIRNQDLKLSISDEGYLRVGLYRPGRPALKREVHILVAQAFLSRESLGLQVNHIDGNKTNNHVWNLEWVTPSENIRHAYRTGLVSGHGGVSKTPIMIVETGEVFESIRACARALDCHPSAIHRCIDGYRTNVKGHSFRTLETV